MNQPPPAASGNTPPAALSLRRLLRDMLVLRPLARPRLLFSLRASLSLGMPVLAGWLAGDMPAGLLAATGGFTALYGKGRPWASRAVELAIIAFAFATAVAVGMAVAAWPAAVVPTVALIAMLATWLGNAMQIGPPGAYMFLLACAAATAMPATHIASHDAFALVLAGGAFAWLLQMSGAMIKPRGPEQRAVASAAQAVTGFLEAIGSDAEGSTRQVAARALGDAWQALTSFQPPRVAGDSTLAALRARTRQLNGVFAQAMQAAAEDRRLPPDLAEHARRLGDPHSPVTATDTACGVDPAAGDPDAATRLREALRPRSWPMLVVARVGLAALLAGALGAALDLDRAYWAVAAAVLMLHQGLEGQALLRRCIERLVGTWIGLLLAGTVLWFQPQGLAVVVLIMVLQFAVEMLVLRNYALAAIFITAAALTLAAGGQPVPDLGSYLLARGVDTAIGCAVALLVFRLTWPQASTALLPEQLIRTLAAIDTLAVQLAQGDASGDATRRAQRELQHRCFSLTQAWQRAAAASRVPQRPDERLWPGIAATEELAFRLLGSCWSLQRLDRDSAQAQSRELFADGLPALRESLRRAIEALEQDGNALPQAADGLAAFLAADVHNLFQALRSEGA